MPLTAEDVRNKQFTRSRLRGGYDEAEVDDFLDQVEAELGRLHRENADLRARLAAAEQALKQAEARPSAPSAPAPGGENPQEAAIRVLAAAQRTADEMIAEAKREADRLMGEARSRIEQLERETQEKHRAVVGNLDAERERLERKVEELRAFEREYRARLKAYLENQLRDLEGRGADTPVRPSAPSVGAPPGPGASSGAPPVPPLAPPAQPRPPSGPFAPAAPPAAGPSPTPPGVSPSPGSGAAAAPPSPGIGGHPEGPGGPVRQAPPSGFEVEEGPEIPPTHG